MSAQTSDGGWSVSRPETLTRRNSASAVIEYSTLRPRAALAAASSGSLFALRILDVHLRVRAVRRGFRVADVDRQAHVGQDRAQRRQAEHDVVRAAAVAHEADAPDLAGERPEAGADLDAELVEQRLPHLGFVHAFGAAHGIHLRQLVFLRNQ